MSRPSKPLIERFGEKVDRRGIGECWPWMACLDKYGYGRISKGLPTRKMLFAHRVAYELQNGPIPEGQKVLHTCDNPKCVNAAHLFLGTQQDNITDMVEKGRQKTKLTKAQVAEIRRIYVRWDRVYGQCALARKYNVSSATIGRIVNGKNWRR